MKRWIRVIMFVTMMLSVTACGKKQTISGEQKAPEALTGSEAMTSSEAMTGVDETKAIGEGDFVETKADPVYDDSLIEEVIAEKGICTGWDGCNSTYSYHVPKLLGDTEGIKAVNREIDEAVGSMVREELEQIRLHEPVFCERVEWESHWRDGLLSLVVSASNTDGNPVYNGVFHYDFAQDRRPDNAELLKLSGINEDEYLNNARQAAAEFLDTQYPELGRGEQYLEMYYRKWNDYGYPSVLALRADTISAIQGKNASPIADEDSWCYMLPIQMYRYEVPWWVNMQIDPESVISSGVQKVVEDDVVTARLENNRVFLSFADSEQAAYYLYGYGEEDFDYMEGGRGYSLPCDELKLGADYSYEVQGLFSDYRDIYLGTVGDVYAPYLFLLTTQGTLEFVDIISCARYGTFCAMPCPGDFSGCTFAEEEASAYGESARTVFAVFKDGQRQDLSDIIRKACEAVPLGLWSGAVRENRTNSGTYSTVGNWMFRPDNTFTFTLTELDAPIAEYNGSIRALGMTEQGIVCGYSFKTDADITATGSFVYYYGENTEETYYRLLPIRFLTWAETLPYDAGEELIVFEEQIALYD